MDQRVTAELDKLSVDQVRAFDKEYVNDKRWLPIQRSIDGRFPGGEFSFLDVGGGNGVFADRVLRAYPKARGTVLDSSEHLIERNSRSERKQVLLGNAAELLQRGLPKFDLVFCNWLLHHLVTSGDYRRTRDNIRSVLGTCKAMLTPRGAISVYENDCDGLIDAFTGYAVFRLTSSRALAPLVSRLGSNTAGVGVCFLSHRQWVSEFARCGLGVTAHTPDDPWTRKWTRDLPLLVRQIAVAHYWLEPA